MEEMPIIPIYTYTSKHLIHPSVEGFALEPDGFTELEIRETHSWQDPPRGTPLMLRFLLVRILQALPVIFVVITATFFLVRSAPGGPFDQEKVVIPEVRAALEAQYRLDLPLHEQYFAYLGDLAQGDLGPSFKYPGRSVNEILFAGLPVTAELGFMH